MCSFAPILLGNDETKRIETKKKSIDRQDCQMTIHQWLLHFPREEILSAADCLLDRLAIVMLHDCMLNGFFFLFTVLVGFLVLELDLLSLCVCEQPRSPSATPPRFELFIDRHNQFNSIKCSLKMYMRRLTYNNCFTCDQDPFSDCTLTINRCEAQNTKPSNEVALELQIAQTNTYWKCHDNSAVSFVRMMRQSNEKYHIRLRKRERKSEWEGRWKATQVESRTLAQLMWISSKSPWFNVTRHRSQIQCAMLDR